jgi:AraC family ethanolamine operon transcriptional activator
MPTQAYPSPEAHAAAVQNANLRIALLAKSRAPWTLSSLALHNLRAQWGQVGGGTLVEGTATPGAVLIFVPTQNVRVMRMNGRRFDAQTFRLQIPGDELCLASTDWHGWFSMSIPNAVFAEWSGIGTMAIRPASRFIRVPWERAETFQRVVAQLGSIVQRAPGALESSAAAKTTARKLAESVREALWGKPAATPQPGRRSVPRRQIIRAAMDCVDQHDWENLTVSELATAAGVSERTLRTAFQEYFGIGPVGYLKRRTLNLVRTTLQTADPSVMTVTQVAMQFGVWELGRFAQDYRLLFGELPSATLRRQH